MMAQEIDAHKNGNTPCACALVCAHDSASVVPEGKRPFTLSGRVMSSGVMTFMTQPAIQIHRILGGANDIIGEVLSDFESRFGTDAMGVDDVDKHGTASQYWDSAVTFAQQHINLPDKTLAIATQWEQHYARYTQAELVEAWLSFAPALTFYTPVLDPTTDDGEILWVDGDPYPTHVHVTNTPSSREEVLLVTDVMRQAIPQSTIDVGRSGHVLTLLGYGFRNQPSEVALAEPDTFFDERLLIDTLDNTEEWSSIGPIGLN